MDGSAVVVQQRWMGKGMGYIAVVQKGKLVDGSAAGIGGRGWVVVLEWWARK